jgi:hypothetical protein
VAIAHRVDCSFFREICPQGKATYVEEPIERIIKRNSNLKEE